MVIFQLSRELSYIYIDINESNFLNRPFAAMPQRDSFSIKLWAIT